MCERQTADLLFRGCSDKQQFILVFKWLNNRAELFAQVVSAEVQSSQLSQALNEKTKA